jgi:hypothetical protein
MSMKVHYFLCRFLYSLLTHLHGGQEQKELHKECSIANKDQQSIQVCYHLTKTYPEQVTIESPSVAHRAAAEGIPEVAAAYASLSDVTTDLASSKYIPAVLRGTGIPLFKHMVSR